MLTSAISCSKINITINQWLFPGKVEESGQKAGCRQTRHQQKISHYGRVAGGGACARAQRGANYINMGKCLQRSTLAHVTRSPGCHVWWAVELHLPMIELLNLWYYARCVLIQHRLTYRAIVLPSYRRTKCQPLFPTFIKTNQKGSYPHSLTVGADVGRGPVRQTLDVKRVSLRVAVILTRRRPLVKKNVHQQLLTGRKRCLDADPDETTSHRCIRLTAALPALKRLAVEFRNPCY